MLKLNEKRSKKLSLEINEKNSEIFEYEEKILMMEKDLKHLDQERRKISKEKFDLNENYKSLENFCKNKLSNIESSDLETKSLKRNQSKNYETIDFLEFELEKSKVLLTNKDENINDLDEKIEQLNQIILEKNEIIKMLKKDLMEMKIKCNSFEEVLFLFFLSIFNNFGKKFKINLR